MSEKEKLETTLKNAGFYLRLRAKEFSEGKCHRVYLENAIDRFDKAKEKLDECK